MKRRKKEQLEGSRVSAGAAEGARAESYGLPHIIQDTQLRQDECVKLLQQVQKEGMLFREALLCSVRELARG